MNTISNNLIGRVANSLLPTLVASHPPSYQVQEIHRTLK